MKIRLKDIKAKASIRPEGYVAAVLAKGTLSGDVLTLTPQSYSELLKQFNPTTALPPVSKSKCCGKGKASPTRLTMPPITRQLANVTKAAGRVIRNLAKNKAVQASEELIKERQNICKECEFFDQASNRCSQCGCRLRYKLQLSTETCPKNFW